VVFDVEEVFCCVVEKGGKFLDMYHVVVTLSSSNQYKYVNGV